MQTSLETPKRANTGAECPKLLTHSLIHESLCPSSPHDSAPLLLLFPCSLLRDARISSLEIHAVTAEGDSPMVAINANCKRERSNCYDMQIVEIFLRPKSLLQQVFFSHNEIAMFSQCLNIVAF